MTAGVGFDLDHTLLFDNKLERVAFLRLLEDLLDEGGRIDGTITDEVERIDALLDEQRAGAFSIDDAVARYVRERGVAPNARHVERFRSMAVEMVDEFVTPFPGTKRAFATLRERGYVLAVLSNGWNPLQIRKAQRCGFDGPVLASADIGQQKPGARAFDALMAALGTPRESTWYLGDDPRADVAGARDAGLHGIWMDVDRKPYPLDIMPPESTIHALDDLLAVLPGVERVVSR